MNSRIFLALCLALTTAILLQPRSYSREPSPATEAMLKGESLGGLKLGLAATAVLKQLGKPESQSKLSLQEADGTYVQHWEYPVQGLSLWMTSGAKKSGVKSISAITAFTGCKLATKAGIKIGSPESAVRKAYGTHESKDDVQAGQLVAGSVYGGIIFNFTKGKVSGIFLGAAAE
jgi:hypothetical protein